MIESPLNYTGGKFRLLPQILPLFPENIRIFVDLFCGGCNVGLNSYSQSVIYNDADKNLIGFYNTLKNLKKEVVFELIYQIIDDYKLSLVSKYGYKHYECDSAKGLSRYNKEKYLKLRSDFNFKYLYGDTDDHYYIILYVLIVYAFNNQIRFNRNGEFNLPVGKRDFNNRMQKKLAEFIDCLHERDYKFTAYDFRDFDMHMLKPRDFVYADPPYLVTCATYNEQDGWNEDDEKDLLTVLDKLHSRKIRFALSNVLKSKGRKNKILLNWTKKNAEKYKVHHLNYSYSNSNYHVKDKVAISDEVLITNY